jgi:hypothetical protein
LESRKDKRKVKKRRKSRHKSLDTSAAAASGNKTPKITYNNRAGTHKSQQQHHLPAGTHNSRHHSAASQYSSPGVIPSIRVECPSATADKMEAAQQQKRQSAIAVKNLSSYGGPGDEDSDEPRSAAGGDTDDSDSERVKAGRGGDESPRTGNSSSFHETFAKFRQSYLSSTTPTAPKKV